MRDCVQTHEVLFLRLFIFASNILIARAYLIIPDMETKTLII